MSKPTVFLSYSHEDSKIADELDSALNKCGVTLKRDIRDVKYRQKFSEFMIGVRDSDYVLMLISDHFLKSEYCMYEVAEFTKDHNYDNRILPIVLDNARIYDYEDCVGYIEYWKNKYTSIKKRAQDLELEEISIISKGALRFREFSLILGSFIEQIRDINHKNYIELKKNHFKDILSVIGLISPNIEESYEAKTEIASNIKNVKDTLPSKDFTNEVKVIVLGDSAVGKTALIRRITSEKYIPTESTMGISIKDWEFRAISNRHYKVHFWDFGGQELYHLTHQLFLSKMALYVVVWDARSENVVERIAYWLRTINLFAPTAHILVVCNKIDVRIMNIDKKSLSEQFPNIASFHKVSAKNGEGINALINQLRDSIDKSKFSDFEYPLSWDAARKKLQHLEQPIIQYNEYVKTISAEGINEDQADLLLSILHDLGDILYFKDSYILRESIILQPNWVTQCIYKVLESNLIMNNFGRFKYGQLKDIWKEYTKENHVFLLELMRRFELCYSLPNSDEFIIPEMLPPNKPEYEWNFEKSFLYQFRYQFMPRTILTRLMVRMSAFILNNTVWRNGVVLENEKAKALIISDKKSNSIKLYLFNDNFASFYGNIRREISQIHSTIANLNFDEMLQCTCSYCRNTNEPTFYNYSTLIKFYTKGKDSITCPISIEDVSIKEELDLVKDLPNRNEKELIQIIENVKEPSDNEHSLLSKINDIIQIQPNFFGISINLNALVKTLLKRKKQE